jgi:cell filamentation protein, protein adenylyltransferase
MVKFNKKEPFNGLPKLPPKAKLETTKVLRKTITASRALAQLNGAIINLPNLKLFIDSIQLLEAKASSEIENIITTNEKLYQSLISDKKMDDPAAKEILGYKDALWKGLEKLKTRPFITTNLCIEIMQGIRQNSSGIRNLPGTTLSNAKGEVIYTPPTGEDLIRKKLANLERFINEDSPMDPLIKMALMHYQFEAIHPFSDGNGRTGRILLLLYLQQQKLLDISAIFLSEYIIHTKSEYFKRIISVTENEDWENWILYMLEMVEFSAKKGLERFERISELMQKMSNDIKAVLPKVYSNGLIEELFKLPYTKIKFLVDAGLGTSKTVGNYLISLEQKGFLESEKVGKEKLYLNRPLFEILKKN